MDESLELTPSPMAAPLPVDLVWRSSPARLARTWGAVGLALLLLLVGGTRLWQGTAHRTVAPTAPPAIPAALPAAAMAAVHAAGQVVVAMAKAEVIAPLRQADAWTHRRYATGEASYYARGFEGRSTASGEPYRAKEFTAAHRTLPFGTMLRVTNVRTGRSVVVRVNDRGPFHSRRIVDLSRAAAAELGLVHRGRGRVQVDVLSAR
jgi:peptidoglycan lytic transglycosylase